MRSMLCLVQDQMEQQRLRPAAAAIPDETPPDLLDGLDPDSPEAVFVRYIRSLGPAELAEMRRELCLSALAVIDGELAEMSA